jgi:Domain of unknown function (DUF4386)
VRSLERWSAATGVGYVLLAVIGFVFAPDPPAPSISNDGLLGFFEENTQELAFQVFFFGLASICFLWFVGTLAGAMRRAEDDPALRLHAIALAGGTAANAVFVAGMVCWAAMAASADSVLDQGVARGLYDLGRYAYTLSGLPAAAFVLAVSVGVLRTGFLPNAVGWAGGVLTLILIVDVGGATVGDSDSFGPTGTYGVFTFLLFLVWTLVTSLFLVQRIAPSRTAPEG